MQEHVKFSLIHHLSKESLDLAESLVPWYLEMLPSAYFREVSESTRYLHLKGIAALKGIDQDMSLTLNSVDEEDNTVITVLRNDARPGTLHQVFASVRHSRSDYLRSVRAYSALDDSLTLNVFTYSDKKIASSESEAHSVTEAQAEKHLKFSTDQADREVTLEYLSHCHPTYVAHCSPARLQVHRDLYNSLKGTDDVGLWAEPYTGEELKDKENKFELTIATAIDRPERLLQKITALLAGKGINIVGLHVDMINDPLNPIADHAGSVCMIRVLIGVPTPSEQPTGLGGSDFTDLNSKAWNLLADGLRRIKWMAKDTLDLGLKEVPEFGLERAGVLTGLVSMLTGPLGKINSLSYSRGHMLGIVKHPLYLNYMCEIADLFLQKFDPQGPLTPEQFESKSANMRTRLSSLTNEPARVLMQKMVDAVEMTLRTNFFYPGRYALAFRVDPRLLVTGDQEVPFGAVFVTGEGFEGFHNRFQNIARGGLRLVTPPGKEQYAMESSRCYDEVYGLSFAQQLKNKDIPEGGSKAVMLVDVAGVPAQSRNRVMRTKVRAFTDALLDLIVKNEDTRQYMVDYLGFDELIYLGPDEQIIPEDINWIIQRAARRGYPIPAAFMSSKPMAGINHKEYGVTSEGVAVFLDVALRKSGINPDEEEFSVKITGGPDGDVAGNLMRILFREYGDKAKIVGIADGSGCAEDPNGIHHGELMRLFEAALPIGDLDQSTLSPQGVVHLADNDEGIRVRNNMYNRVQADVFVPGGGRPSTMHEGNWTNFLDADGVPSSPLIVEGANIFITPSARKHLYEKAGVTIVKDSSANKCGVITSSYEICASMLLEEDEFLAIKEELVEDVLVKLRKLARMEAELLFREYTNYPGSLPDFSERLSRSIMKGNAAIRDSLESMERGDDLYLELMPLFLEEHLPSKLAEVAADRVDERIPLDYLKNAFASSLASKLLYREGTHFLESQPTERLADLAINYYRSELHVRHLLESVEKTNLPNAEREEVLALLSQGGARSALQL